MGSLCFSAASILRCESFTRPQAILIIIPTALEVIFSTSLIFTNWGTGRRHLWLTLEGWVYFALALVDMFSEILPAARRGVEIFKAFDIFLAAASFLPIFFYILFIFLFTRAELIDILPRRFQTIAKLMLLAFIPAIVALNEVSSFVGISYREISSPGRPNSLVIGFKTNKDPNIWAFFTSFTLALLTAYQAINFLFAFYRLIQAFLSQRRIETTSSDEVHLFKGIGWITAALKLGAIETIVGFAGGGFGGAMTRRILRFLGRAFLSIGLVKGVDSVEDFKQVRDEMSAGSRREFRRSRLRDFISNPRFSTFRQLTPTATAFHEKPRVTHGLSQFSPPIRDEGLHSDMRQFADKKQFTTLGVDSEKTPRKRVTVNFDNGTPHLHMRFSALEIPASVFNVKSRTTSVWDPVSRLDDRHPAPHHSPDPATSPISLLSSLVITESGHDLKSPPRLYIPASEKARRTKNTPESYTSLSAVRELVSQFPTLPQHDKVQQSPVNARNGDFWDPDSPQHSASVLSHSSSMSKRKPVLPAPSDPADRIDPFSNEEGLRVIVPASLPFNQHIHNLRSPDVPSGPISPPMTTLSGYTQALPGHSILTAGTEDVFLDFGTALDTGRSRSFTRNSSGVTHPADWIDYDAIRPIDELPSIVEEHSELSRAPSDATSDQESVDGLKKGEDMGVLTIPWLKNLEMEKMEQQRVRAASKKLQPARIKSVGKAPMRSTPTPIRTKYARGSLHIEPIMIPPKQPNNMEIIQGSLGLTSILEVSQPSRPEDSSYSLDSQRQGYF